MRFFDVENSLDYYSFGMLMPERFGGGDYRYGYQGSEKDNEVKGEGNSYTTYFRQLDPRLGRWLTIDPKASSLPWQSPYCSMDNNPVLLNDVLGDKVPVKFTRSARKDLGISKKSLKQGQVPERLQTLYNEEYGLKLGLEVSNKKFLGITVGKKYHLTYTGDIPTDLKTSSSAIQMWKEQLDPKSLSNGKIIFDGKGYDWAIPGEVAHINVGSYSGDDFTNPSADYINGTTNLKRSFNMARIIEHEYLGHVVTNVEDYSGQFTGNGKPYGKQEFYKTINDGTAMQVVNKFRREMGLPERIAYDRQRDSNGNGKIEKHEKNKTTILFFGDRKTGGTLHNIIF